MSTIKFLFTIGLISLIVGCIKSEPKNEELIEAIIYNHARAWETGDYELLESILHEDLIFAYPGRRMNKQETLMDFVEYNKSFNDTKIYVSKIIVDGDDLAIEWQFASTNIKTGNRTAVSDAIIGKMKDEKIIVWKEYLDGRVSRMQTAGELPLEEGEEPFPWQSFCQKLAFWPCYHAYLLV